MDLQMRMMHFFNDHWGSGDMSVAESDLVDGMFIPPSDEGPAADFWKRLHHEYLAAGEDFEEALDEYAKDSGGDWTDASIAAVKASHKIREPLTEEDRLRFVDSKVLAQID